MTAAHESEEASPLVPPAQPSHLAVPITGSEVPRAVSGIGERSGRPSGPRHRRLDLGRAPRRGLERPDLAIAIPTGSSFLSSTSGAAPSSSRGDLDIDSSAPCVYGAKRAAWPSAPARSLASGRHPGFCGVRGLPNAFAKNKERRGVGSFFLTDR